MENTLKGSATYGYDSSARSAQEMREAKCVKREGFDKRELTLLSHSELGSESIPCCKLTVLAGKILKPSWIMRLCPKAWFWASYGFRFAHPTANPLQDDNYDNSHNEPLTLHSSPLTKSAFTMAEILLSLTIIGVVAAITLPSLTGNINERTWNTQKRALYSRMNQAIALMPSLNNYGSTDINASETFITSGLSKVLKINNICGYGTDGSTLFDCGLSSQIINIAGTKIDLPKEVGSLNEGITGTIPGTTMQVKNTKAAAFETANGESVLTFYNPNCTAENVIFAGSSASSGGYNMGGQYVKQQVCVNFVYDLNGKKGPNTMGKDLGMITVVYSSDSKVVMPMNPKPLPDNMDYSGASSACRSLGTGEYRLPNIEEVLSIYYNKNLVGGTPFGSTNGLWSSTVQDAEKAFLFGGTLGMKYPDAKENPYSVLCVER